MCFQCEFIIKNMWHENQNRTLLCMMYGNCVDLLFFAWQDLKWHLALLIKHLYYKKNWLKNYDEHGGNQGLDQWPTCPNFDGSN
jgi:hypothetical protein